jgi:hypothetical protein
VYIRNLSAKVRPEGTKQGKLNVGEPVVEFESLTNKLDNDQLDWLEEGLLRELTRHAKFLTHTSLSRSRANALKLLNLTSHIGE